MDEIITKVSERTGVAPDTVQKVLTSAADFLKQKLPPQFASQVDAYLQGSSSESGQGIGNMIGNLFGKG